MSNFLQNHLGFASMDVFIPIILVVVIAILIFKSLGKSDPAAEQCAKEVIQLLKSTPNASAEEISQILKSHQRTKTDAGKVTVIVKTRLSQSNIRKEKHNDVMLRVRKARELLD